MKRIGLLRKRFLTRERLLAIVEHLTRRSKQKSWTPRIRQAWTEFLADEENNVERLWQELRYQVFVPQGFIIFEKKEGDKLRTIYASWPREQIVDNLLTDILQYVMCEAKQLIPRHCYGSVTGKGQHELRRIIINKLHGCSQIKVLVGDVKKYYPTILHAHLMQELGRHIKDRWVLWLCRITLERMPGGRGLALGLPSSNLLGHLNFLRTDWMMLSSCGFRNYFRFCDDIIIIHTNKNYLHTGARILRGEVERCGQQLKPAWRVVGVGEHPVEFLGALINTRGARLKPSSRRRIERRMRTVQRSEYVPEEALRSWSGMRGGMKNLQASNLIRYWKDRYPEFFRRVRADRSYLRREHRMFVRHKRQCALLADAFGVRKEDVA